MAGPLSQDIRKRIIEAKERGDAIRKIASEKSVSKSTVTRICKLYRETGSYEPRTVNNGAKPRLTPEELQAVKERILRQPDITLMELIDEMHLPLCESALCKIVNDKLGLRRKKNGSCGRTGT